MNLTDALPVTAGDSAEDRSDGPLKISGSLSIRTITELHRQLSAYAVQGPDLVVDLSAVQECDTAGLQLIVSLRKTAAERKQHLLFAHVSPALAETAAALGFAIVTGGDDRGL
ncbi:MAG TPA: STAS domain-containing protein [Bryobacteraceae bacterium]